MKTKIKSFWKNHKAELIAAGIYVGAVACGVLLYRFGFKLGVEVGKDTVKGEAILAALRETNDGWKALDDETAEALIGCAMGLGVL